jgi:hypothetical protein
MRAQVTLLEQNYEVEYDFKITSYGCPATGPSYSSGGEPAEGPEFEITVHEIVGKEGLPDWLKLLLEEHLAERDDIIELVNEAASEPEEPDYDRE